MSLNNCKINFILTWSDKCVLSNDAKATAFAITDTKLYVTLSIQDKANLLHQIKLGFKRTVINWNKYQSKVTIQEPNPYLDYLIHPSSQGVSGFFDLSLKNYINRKVHTNNYLQTVEKHDYNR